MKNVFNEPLCFSKLYLLYLLYYERVNIYPFYFSLLPNASANTKADSIFFYVAEEI